jgi:polysaccharide export outer membrane protein
MNVSRYLKLINFLLLLLVIFNSTNSSILGTEAQNQATNSVSQPAGTQTAAPPPAKVDSDFIIGAGDVLNIFVWKEQELSKTVPVRPDGKISLPLINDVEASGKTALQLKETLTEMFKAYITDPTVTVTVETVNSQKVTIMGEVTQAGTRPLTGPLRVMDILASTGFTPFAKTSRVSILRNVDEKQQKYLFNYKE